MISDPKLSIASRHLKAGTSGNLSHATDAAYIPRTFDSEFVTATTTHQHHLQSSGFDQQHTNMATATVFGIVELLQMILIELAVEEANIGELTGLQFNPALSLFKLQRVNTTFQSAIQSSTEIRRLMFLEHAEPGSKEATELQRPESDHESANLRPMWWLFEFFRGWSSNRYMTQPPTYGEEVVLEDIDISYFQGNYSREPKMYGLPANRLAAALRPKASWKMMKLFRIPRSEKLAIEQHFELLEGRYYHSMFFDACSVRIVVDSSWTIGAFWDYYHKHCGREEKKLWAELLAAGSSQNIQISKKPKKLVEIRGNSGEHRS